MTEFERQLAGVKPAETSVRLKQRVRAGLRGEGHSHWLRWIMPVCGAACLVLLSLATMEVGVNKADGAAVTWGEIPLNSRSGFVYQDGEPVRVTSTVSQAYVATRDPRTGREVVNTFPRQQIEISKLEIQ
jgi:hypothetical protein